MWPETKERLENIGALSATVSREEYEAETALAWGEVSKLRKELAESKSWCEALEIRIESWRGLNSDIENQLAICRTALDKTAIERSFANHINGGFNVCA